ncbi:hypothetical protein IHE45_07G097000 [Dioscorea alata]|uniref:Uncharacterized protein n=1 Tax=Dioscorea alata TaxID=55571 RepID=A0ACB7VTD9_DIOAL|nr:hypothetical protein IHE45_07G097000 [Dioscorea alata]
MHDPSMSWFKERNLTYLWSCTLGRLHHECEFKNFTSSVYDPQPKFFVEWWFL